MASPGFGAFETIDKNLQHQQNINRLPIQIFVHDAPNNKLDTLSPYIKKLADHLLHSSAHTVVKITLD
jgi:hypothetical protein